MKTIDLKELMLKPASLICGVIGVTALTLLAELATGAGAVVAKIPCLYILGQPEMPDSLLQKIQESEIE